MAGELLKQLTLNKTDTKENLSDVVAQRLEDKFRIKIGEEGRGQLRQRMAEINLSKPVQMFGYSIGGKLTKLNLESPITQGGTRIRLSEPDNALQIAYREAGGKENAWGILDNITIVNRKGQTEDVAPRRYLTSNLFYKNKKDMKAAAAEFEIPGVDNRELARWIRNNLEVDQGILEFYRDGEPTSGWIHCSYSVNTNRQQWLRAMREEGKVIYKPWLE